MAKANTKARAKTRTRVKEKAKARAKTRARLEPDTSVIASQETAHSLVFAFTMYALVFQKRHNGLIHYYSCYGWWREFFSYSSRSQG